MALRRWSFALLCFWWPHQNCAENTGRVNVDGPSLSNAHQCINSAITAGSVEAKEDLETLRGQLESAFQAVKGDESEAMKARAQEVLFILAFAWPTFPTIDAVPNATVQSKNMSGQAKKRLEDVNSRRLSNGGYIYGTPTVGPASDADLLANCEDDPDMRAMWGIKCTNMFFVDCKITGPSPQAWDAFGYMSLPNWEILMARCPVSCHTCHKPIYSPANLLARCEDHPYYWIGTATLESCDSLAPRGYCVDPDNYDSVFWGVWAETNVPLYCPRSCKACVKCGVGRRIHPNGILPDITKRDSEPDFCVDCLPGKHTPDTDLPQCEDCAVGTFAATNGTSACTRCPKGSYQDEEGATYCKTCVPVGGDPDMWTTRDTVVFADGSSSLLETNGVTTAEKCGCIPGTIPQPNNVTCERCGEGLSCDGVSTSPVISPRYWAAADKPFSVYKCELPEACSGGLPGVCAYGRKGSSLQCGECKDDYQEGDGGKCEPCGETGVLPLIMVIILVVAVLFVVYIIIAREDRMKQKTSTVLITISFGLLVTVAQQLKVFSLLAMDYPDPFKSLLEVMTVFGMDMSVLGLGCVGRISPVTKFGFNLLNIACILGILGIVHICFAIYKGKGSDMHVILNCYGTIFTAFATAISSLTFAPFQCLSHPNNDFTMKGYPTVLCWDSADHAMMVLIGVLASLILFSCVGACLYVVSRFPARMRKGDTDFLKSTSFLFSRFRVGAHFYGLVCLVRGMLVALVPVLPSALTQCVLLLVLLLYSTATSYVLPWRVPLATFLDVCVQTALIMVLVLALFFADDKPDPKLISQLCCAVVGIALCLVFIAFSYGIFQKYVLKRKEYQYFLCHHKGGCGSFARLMKMHLLESPKVKAKVFLDSDDLQDLNKLFDFVRNDLSTLVVLCSKEVLMRPWCAGEMTTARVTSVPVRLILFQDFNFPDEKTIENYGTLVPGCSTLSPHGIDEDMVQTTLRWIPSNPTIKFDSGVNIDSLDKLCKTVISDGAVKSPVTIDLETTPQTGKNKVVILADLAYGEAASTAYVLEKLLPTHMFQNPDLIPRLLADKEELPKACGTTILICSRGCFLNPHLVRRLLQGNEQEVSVIPVVSEEAFRFPTEPFFDSLRGEGKMIMDSAGSDADIELLVGIIKAIFSEIAVVLHAWNDSYVDLNVRAQVVARRLLQGSTVAKSATVTSRPSQQVTVEDQSI